MTESDSEMAERVRRAVESHGGWEEEQYVEVIGTDMIWDGPTLRIYEKPAVIYTVESPKGDKAIEIMIKRLGNDELSSMEELDLGKTEAGKSIARKTPKSGVKITAKVLSASGGYSEMTKFVTSDEKDEYTTIDVKGTKKPGWSGIIYKGDATVDYGVMSEKINCDVEPVEREKVMSIKIEPLTRKELWEGMDIDLARTEPSGNFGRRVSHRMAEGGVRMTITDGKYTETKIVTYR